MLRYLTAGGLDLQHPPEKVWRALSCPEPIAEWLLPVLDFNLESGAEFTFRTQAYPGWDGMVNSRLLEIEPHRKLRYPWTVPFLDTVVTFTLMPTATGTRLMLVQSGSRRSRSGGQAVRVYGWR